PLVGHRLLPEVAACQPDRPHFSRDRIAASQCRQRRFSSISRPAGARRTSSNSHCGAVSSGRLPVLDVFRSTLMNSASQRACVVSCAALCCWLASAFAIAAENDDPFRPPAIATQDVPPVPAELTERLRQYQAVRSAAFRGWSPDGTG